MTYQNKQSGKGANDGMELTAVIEALCALKEPCEVTLTTDSAYICNAVNNGWVYGWRKNGWIKSDKKRALNSDLWEKLLTLMKINKVEFVWVKGHNGHPYNERCDRLAVAYIKDLKRKEKEYKID